MDNLFLFVTANETETTALLNCGNDFLKFEPNLQSNLPHDANFYNVGKFGCYDIVHLELIDQASARQAASILSISNAIDAFHPDAVILVGVAFGSDDRKGEKQIIGDVIVSKTVTDYESGVIREGILLSDGAISEAGKFLISTFNAFSKTWNFNLNSRPAKCFLGNILSGDKFVDDYKFKSQLLKRYPLAYGGEMEGRGAYAACRDRGVSEWIIVKGICDWGDGTTSQDKLENQKIAAESAVSLLMYIFSNPVAFNKLPKNKRDYIKDCLKQREQEVSSVLYAEEKTAIPQMEVEITNTNNQKLKRFKVAFSFPGEHRILVEKIAEILANIYGKESILYDKYHKAEFARPNLDTHLQILYRDQSDLIVVFVCSDYQRKMWCGIEWHAIRDLLNQKDADERIMFIKCDDGSVNGVFGTIDGYIDSTVNSISDITSDIIKRHDILSKYQQTLTIHKDGVNNALSIIIREFSGQKRMLASWKNKLKHTLLPIELTMYENQNKSTIDFKNSYQAKKLVDELSPLMFVGVGGVGKSTLLQYIFDSISKDSKCLYISLPEFYHLIKLEDFPLHDIKIDCDCLILDGLNEMSDKGFDTSDNVTSTICNWISDIALLYSNVKLIIAGRSADTEFRSIKRLFSHEFNYFIVDGISITSEAYGMISVLGDDTLKKLLLRPLYFNTYMKLSTKAELCSRFDLLSQLYEQTFDSNHQKVALCKFPLEKFHDYTLPKIAFEHLSTSVDFEIQSTELTHDVRVILEYYDVFIVKTKLDYGREQYRFSHNDYIDFLAAKYIKARVDEMKIDANSKEICVAMENLSSDTKSMLVEALCGFAIDDNDYRVINNIKKNKTSWWTYFVVDHYFHDGNLSLPITHIQDIMDIGFELGFFLADSILHPDNAKNIYYEGYKELIMSYFRFISQTTLTIEPLIAWSDWNDNHDVLGKTIRKNVELLRRSQHISAAYGVLESALKFSDEKSKLGLTHQRAKLKLNEFQYSSSCKLEDFEEGVATLIQCADANYCPSCNLLGRLYAEPAPIIEKKTGKVMRNNKHGFEYYYRVIKNTQYKKTLTIFEQYAYIRCIKMLLFVNISLRDGAFAAYELMNNDIIAIEQVNPGGNSISIAKELFSRLTDNRPLPKLLSAIIDYFEGNYNTSLLKASYAYNAEVDLGTLIPSIMIMHLQKKHQIVDDKIDYPAIIEFAKNQYLYLKDQANNLMAEQDFERYHPKYILEDVNTMLRWFSELTHIIFQGDES